MACVCGHSREEHTPECCECPCIAYGEDLNDENRYHSVSTSTSRATYPGFIISPY